MLKEGLRKSVVQIAKGWLWSGTHSQRAAKLSLALHVFLVVLCLSCGLIQSCIKWLKPKKTVHVFSLEALPDRGPSPYLEPTLGQPQAQPEPKTTTTKPSAIRFKPPPKIDPKPKAQQAKASEKPKQSPTKAAPAPKQPKSAKTQPDDASKRLSYEEFLKNNPKVAAKTVAKSKPVVDGAKVLQTLASPYPSASQGAVADDLGAYIGQMKLCIDEVWKKPSGLRGGVEALVEFFVDKNGIISKFKIIKSSHNKLFDQSIEEALGSGLLLTPPPGGKAQTFQLTFKSVD